VKKIRGRVPGSSYLAERDSALVVAPHAGPVENGTRSALTLEAGAGLQEPIMVWHRGKSPTTQAALLEVGGGPPAHIGLAGCHCQGSGSQGPAQAPRPALTGVRGLAASLPSLLSAPRLLSRAERTRSVPGSEPTLSLPLLPPCVRSLLVFWPSSNLLRDPFRVDAIEHAAPAPRSSPPLHRSKKRRSRRDLEGFRLPFESSASAVVVVVGVALEPEQQKHMTVRATLRAPDRLYRFERLHRLGLRALLQLTSRPNSTCELGAQTAPGPRRLQRCRYRGRCVAGSRTSSLPSWDLSYQPDLGRNPFPRRPSSRNHTSERYLWCPLPMPPSSSAPRHTTASARVCFAESGGRGCGVVVIVYLGLSSQDARLFRARERLSSNRHLSFPARSPARHAKCACGMPGYPDADSAGED